MQMDLLTWTPPRRVFVFPLTRRVGRIRHVAAKLSQKHGFMADTYWRQTVTTLRTQMERAGIPPEEITAELRDFFDAVQAELHRIAYERHRGQRPGGDAA